MLAHAHRAVTAAATQPVPVPVGSGKIRQVVVSTVSVAVSTLMGCAPWKFADTILYMQALNQGQAPIRPPLSTGATGAPPSPAADSPLCTCFAVRRLSRRVTALYDRHLQSAGLKTTQYSLLSWLRKRGALPMADLAHRMGMERSTLTRNVQPLIDAGLIRRRRALPGETGADPRARLLELTDDGIARFRLASQQWRRAQNKMADLMGSEPLDSLHALIDLTLKTLPEDGPE